MRLDEGQRRVIRETVRQRLGREAEVYLFGSRLDDAARGGDIDLLVVLPGEPDAGRAVAASQLEAALQRRLGGRQVDVILLTPRTPRRPIHEHALRTGVRL